MPIQARTRNDQIESNSIHTRETRAAAIIMDRLPRHSKPKATERRPNTNNHQIEDGQGNLPWRVKVSALVHEEPGYTA